MQIHSLLTRITKSFFCAALLAATWIVSAQAQNSPKQHTSNVTDRNKKSAFEVDPVTLALNINISLADYPGRGLSLPISLHYNSKSWSVMYSQCHANEAKPYHRVDASYCNDSSSGWNTSLGVPEIRYLAGTESYIALFTGNLLYPDIPSGFGQPWNDECPPACSSLSCPVEAEKYYAARLMLQMPDGSSHEMRNSDLLYWTNLPNGVYEAVDSSRLRYDDNTQTVYLPDGSRYLLNTQSGAQYVDRNGNTLTYNASLRQWTDTLGRNVKDPLSLTVPGTNYIWTPPAINAGGDFIFRWRQLGDVRTDPSRPLKHVSGISHIDSSGDPVALPQGGLFDGAFPPLTPPPPPIYLIGGTELFNPSVLHEIQLPNNQRYVFTYNEYGEIDKVVLPDGGYKRYKYARISPLSPFLSDPIYNQVNRGVTDVWESSTGNVSDEAHWTFTQPFPTTPQVVEVTAPDGARTRRSIHPGTLLSRFGFGQLGGGFLAGKIAEEAVFSANNQLMRNDLTTWEAASGPSGNSFSGTRRNPLISPDAYRNPISTRRVEVLCDTGGDPKAKATEMVYDADLNVKIMRHYDYVSFVSGTTAPNGALLRTEETVYLVNDTSIPSSRRDAYRARHLISLPSKTVVRDGSGVVIAATAYLYDEDAYRSTTPYPTVTSWTDPQAFWQPPNLLVRGNVTTVRQWRNYDYSTGTRTNWQDGGVLESASNWSDSNWIETHSWYDQCGNMIKARDSKGNDTTIGYADNFYNLPSQNTFAYPTSVLTVAPGGNGSTTGFTTATKYDYNTGLVREVTDPNMALTAYEYNDPGNLDRLTRVIRPSGGGETTYVYCDGIATSECPAGEISLRTQTLQSGTAISGVWLKDYTLFDGLGRAKRSAHYEGTPGWSVRETQYDALGRAFMASNPEFVATYNANLPGTAVWTTTTYDALSRVLMVTTPDGSKVSTSYNGNQVTVTDQAGKQRSSLTDALGRLVQVNEAPNEPPDVQGMPTYNYQTNYTYDVLDNLIRVRQGGFSTPSASNPIQFRSFYYDSLSRLVFANNPEQTATIVGPNSTFWTMKYEYDANGNLTKRTDARGVVTDHLYDALNRNYKTTYSNDPNGTLGVERYYDQISANEPGIPNMPNFTNGKGRLRMVARLNSQTNQRVSSTTIIGGYDSVGRVKEQTQGFQRSNGFWSYFPITLRQYDLAGHWLSQAYPSTRFVYNEYNSAGRLAKYRGDLGTSGLRDYASDMRYNAAGLMTRETFNTTTTPTYHSVGYNNRFQMVEVNLGKVASEPPSWSRGKLAFYYSQAAIDANDPYKEYDANMRNNGNMLRQEHRVPTGPEGNEEASSAYPMRDDYQYDALNRLAGVTGRQVGVQAPIYTQNYLYDKFGNRRIDVAQTSGNNINKASYDISTLTNRIVGETYDEAGNLLRGKLTAVTAQYDAENRMITSSGAGPRRDYGYDGDGRRVRKIVSDSPGTETWFVYGVEGELVAEYEVTPAVTTLAKEYGYRGGQLLVTAKEDELKWLVADPLGTPRMVLDKSGALNDTAGTQVFEGVIRHDYLPFGEELTPGMGVLNSVRQLGLGYVQEGLRQKFTGKERDGETQLDYFGARYYSNLLGRFTGTDVPLVDQDETDPQSWNMYSYVRNNPLNWIDPLGLAREKKQQCLENGACYNPKTDQYELPDEASGYQFINATVRPGLDNMIFEHAQEVEYQQYRSEALNELDILPAPSSIGMAVKRSAMARGGANAGRVLATLRGRASRALAAALGPRPSGYHQAHHIVAWGVWRNAAAVAARKILAKWKIDINSAVNGVWLHETFHQGLNSGRYHAEVLRRLIAAQSKVDAEAALAQIARELSQGTFPH